MFKWKSKKCPCNNIHTLLNIIQYSHNNIHVTKIWLTFHWCVFFFFNLLYCFDTILCIDFKQTELVELNCFVTLWCFIIIHVSIIHAWYFYCRTNYFNFPSTSLPLDKEISSFIEVILCNRGLVLYFLGITEWFIGNMTRS